MDQHLAVTHLNKTIMDSTYVILNTTDIKDEDGEVLKDQPSFLDGKTTYTHAEIMVVLRDTDGDWYTEPD